MSRCDVSGRDVSGRDVGWRGAPRRLACALAAGRLALLLCVAVFTAFATFDARAVVVTDQRGVAVEIAAPPRRIVSLLPSLTESVCALGACDRLVGVDRYSNWPASVQALPRVGGGLDPNVEAIVALKPDLVLISKSARAGERLESLGLRVLVLEPENAAGARRVLQQLGRALGTGDADAVWARIDAGVAAAAKSLPPRARGMRVYFEVNDGPYAASESSFIGETLARLGARNIVPGSLGPFPKLNPEFVVRADPELIMIGEREAQALARRPGWDRIGTVRAGRVCRFDSAEGDLLVRPGPRMDEAARWMARCLAEKARP